MGGGLAEAPKGVRLASAAINALKKLLHYTLVIALCIPLALGCYALWDSHQVYERADATQWQPYKPTEPEPLSFWELQRINPEVCAWVSVYGTSIDYPVCKAAPGQEEKYLTTDAKGEYSLSGSLFLDDANASDFGDFSTIVYGHHMDNNVMFGQITDFASQGFFDEHRYGNLFVNDANVGLEFFCYLPADAYDRGIYRWVPDEANARESYLRLLRERALWWREGVDVGPNDRIVLLSTCAAGATNARAILVGKAGGERFANPFVRIPNFGTGVDAQTGLLGIPWWCWLALGLLIMTIAALVVASRAGQGEGERQANE